jgi:glucosyl-dolichyl phosphate glucuronosyltransferase
MSRCPDISIVIATHNRAGVLRDTLRHMAGLNRAGAEVQFVVVDNNSTDGTSDVVEMLAKEMPICHLFEAHPGQNCARNRALTCAPLGDVIVFTDDDIRPEAGWFGAIVEACGRWPQYNVFGGMIMPLWPQGDRPGWTEIRMVKEMGFAYHDHGSQDRPYEGDDFPYSGNLWMRKCVFADGTRFDESVEWHAKNHILATETSFLRHLAGCGHKMMYCPEAVVGHIITAEQISLSGILRRAYSCGRGIARVRGACRRETLDANPVWWYSLRYAAMGRLYAELAASMGALAFGRPLWSIYAMQWLGFNAEQLRLASEIAERR